MLLVAGGQLDINVGVLLRRVLQRGVVFRDIINGPQLTPSIRIDLETNSFVLNGEPIRPSGCFIRHDVFLQQATGDSNAQRISLNWYYAVRGWIAGCENIRSFNRGSAASENNKIENLLLARQAGLKIPATIVSNQFDEFIPVSNELIQKPVAGGEYTTSLDNFLATSPIPSYPRFVQPLLLRPELRVYRVGEQLFGFSLTSSAPDYRTARDVKIELVPVPAELAAGLKVLCNRLSLDFGAADFMRDQTGELIFLEVNSQPMFAAFDDVAGGRLCDAILDFLLPA